MYDVREGHGSEGGRVYAVQQEVVVPAVLAGMVIMRKHIREAGNAAIVVMAVLGAFGLFAASCAACSCTKIDPGHVGVSVKKCSGGGVSDKPIPTGYYWKSVWCEDVIEYPTNLQTLVLSATDKEGSKNNDSITVTSSEGLAIGVDVSLSFTLAPAMVPKIYQKFRHDIDHISETFLRQTVREGMQKSFAKYSAEQLYSDKRDVARAEVQTFLTEHMAKDGFIVSQFTINGTRFPQQVTAAISSKVALIQDTMKAEQEVKRTQAQAKRTQAQAKQREAQAEGEAMAIVLKAEADAKALRTRADAESYFNLTVSKSLTPELIRFQAQQKWDGKLPQFSGGGAVPFIQVPHP